MVASKTCKESEVALLKHALLAKHIVLALVISAHKKNDKNQVHAAREERVTRKKKISLKQRGLARLLSTTMSFAPSQQVPQQQQMYYVSPNMVGQPSVPATAPGGYIMCIGCGVTKAFADTHEGNNHCSLFLQSALKLNFGLMKKVRSVFATHCTEMRLNFEGKGKKDHFLHNERKRNLTFGLLTGKLSRTFHFELRKITTPDLCASNKGRCVKCSMAHQENQRRDRELADLRASQSGQSTSQPIIINNNNSATSSSSSSASAAAAASANGGLPVNHCCHAILTLATAGLWAPIWCGACCCGCCARPCGC